MSSQEEVCMYCLATFVEGLTTPRLCPDSRS